MSPNFNTPFDQTNLPDEKVLKFNTGEAFFENNFLKKEAFF